MAGPLLAGPPDWSIRAREGLCGQSGRNRWKPWPAGNEALPWRVAGDGICQVPHHSHQLVSPLHWHFH